MSNASNIDVGAAITSAELDSLPLTQSTPLAAVLRDENAGLVVAPFCGMITPTRFQRLETELQALVDACGVFDLGWRAQVSVEGEDRLRWLSGMVTNAVQQLPESAGNYSFFLNAQGRIQGDSYVFRTDEQLLLDTTVDQVEALLEHLDRFIIMDDVTLEDRREAVTTLGLAGPKAAGLLMRLGFAVPAISKDAPIAISAGPNSTLIAREGLLTPQYQIACTASQVGELWHRLVNEGAQPCGIDAVEALRIIEGLPRYGVDVNDRDLPQETSQTRALNFNKGCYLGQEIVERIRSRGAVHRALKQFTLRGEMPSLPADLIFADKQVGKLTSAVQIESARGASIYALGIVRAETITRGEPLTYNGGVAHVLDRAPVIQFS